MKHVCWFHEESRFPTRTYPCYSREPRLHVPTRISRTEPCSDKINLLSHLLFNKENTSRARGPLADPSSTVGLLLSISGNVSLQRPLCTLPNPLLLRPDTQPVSDSIPCGKSIMTRKSHSSGMGKWTWRLQTTVEPCSAFRTLR